MIRIGTPNDIYNYIKIANDDDIQNLSINNFIIIWKDNDFVYFRKTKDIIEFMEKEGIVCQN
jgi:hypothetical protein